MSDYLHIAVTFLDPRFHGRGDGGEPEWPPSPLRLMQAIVAANAHRIGVDGDVDRALEWLESQEPPLIVAPRGEEAKQYCLSVPNNAMDVVGKAWSRENYFGSGDANPATHRTMKTVRPMRLVDGDTVHYVWKLDRTSLGDTAVLESVIKAADRVVALGWGSDLVVGMADRLSVAQLSELRGEIWTPEIATGPISLRVPIRGTLAALRQRHEEFLDRIGGAGFAPVSPLTRFQVAGYRRATDPVRRPFAIFELRRDDGSFCVYAQRKLIHVAGMVRHLAKEMMLKSPPPGMENGWVEQYVVGHQGQNNSQHRQLSYLPLPSIGHPHADQAVRRVMIAAPVGDDSWLEHLARRLEGQQLKPLRGDEFNGDNPPTLVRVYRDKVVRCYTGASNRWATVTPVILPGHDDRRPAKTRRLIEAALAQSGVEQPCEFEWSPHSRFPKSYSAHKYGRGKRPTGYLRPDHLPTQTAVHLTLRFNNDLQVPGPISIGAGRHCGLGIFAPKADE